MVILVGRLLAVVIRRLGQPAVIAEVLAGIALGPSLLGLLWPAGLELLFPAASLPGLSLVSQIGLVFFMFLVGLEFDPKLMEGRGSSTIAISLAGIVTPFALGVGLAWPLHGSLAPAGVPFVSFALFMGTAMSITAFPVLARILAERGLMKSRMGAISLACAAVNDVVAWCILAFVVSVARAEGIGSAVRTTALASAYIAFVWFVGRPLLRRLGPLAGAGASGTVVAIAFIALMASAALTDLIGIHALFGSFLIGSVMPRGSGFTRAIVEKVEDFVTIVLLPMFFAYSGLRTTVGELDDLASWAACGAIIAVACVGKFGGSAIVAKMVGLSWRESAAVGVLMNTRGLMELIVLNVGLDLGVLSPALFTMMVIMALVTTWITSPLLERIFPRKEMEKELFVEHPTDLVPRPAALLCLSDPAIAAAMITIGRRLLHPGQELLALHLLRPDRPSVYLQAEPPRDEKEPLDVIAAAAAAAKVPLRTLSFVSANPAPDICEVATAKGAELIVIGVHRPVVSGDPLGGVVRQVLNAASGDVAVFVNHGLVAIERIVVPPGPTHPSVQALIERFLAAGDVRRSDSAEGLSEAAAAHTLVIATLGAGAHPALNGLPSVLLVRPGAG